MIALSINRIISYVVCSFFLLGSLCCSGSERRSGIPPAAQTVIDSAMADIDASRFDKLYQEAADEWRNQSSAEDSRAKLQALRDTLGQARTRALQNAREEQTSTAPVAGHSLTAIYQTTFDRGNGMEAFVLIEHGGRWFLAKYYVSSSGRK